MKKNVVMFALVVLAILCVSPALALAQTPPDLILDAPRAVTLGWKDNSTGEEGFVVERKLNAGAYTPLAIGVVGTGITTLTDSTLAQDQTADNRYCYRVRAFIGTVSSGFSNEACAVVKRAPPAPPADPSDLILKLQQALKAVLDFGIATK